MTKPEWVVELSKTDLELLNAERDIIRAELQLKNACQALTEVRKKFGIDDIGLISNNTVEYNLGDGKYLLQVTFKKLTNETDGTIEEIHRIRQTKREK